MTPNSFRALALGASILMLGAGAALAQAPAHPGGPGHGPRAEQMDPAAMAAKRADKLRASLQLRADQEPALKAFLEATQPRHEPGEMKAMHEEMSKLSTPERLDRMRAKMVEHQAEFDRHIAAIKRFYAQLTPAQQKAFDAQHHGPHMRMHMRHGGPGGGHDGHPGPGGEK